MQGVHPSNGTTCAKESMDYSKHIQDIQNRIFTYLRKKTKLSEQDIQTAMTGHLWLDATQCYKKGIVDKLARVS